MTSPENRKISKTRPAVIKHLEIKHLCNFFMLKYFFPYFIDSVEQGMKHTVEHSALLSVTIKGFSTYLQHCDDFSLLAIPFLFE